MLSNSEINAGKRAAVLWTGGKDSSLAFYKAALSGYEVVNLLTFIPENADFLAHPLSFIKHQAEALGLPHYDVVVKEPLEASYEKAIRSFREEHSIDALITGDIAEVDRYPNYIRERCANSNIEVLTPLWGCDRDTLIYQLLKCKFHVIFSCVKKPHFTCDWLGKPLDIDSLDRLRKMSAEKNFDICGEGGEYHTLVLDGPIFKKRIEIGSHAKHVLGDMMYLKPRDVILREK